MKLIGTANGVLVARRGKLRRRGGLTLVEVMVAAAVAAMALVVLIGTLIVAYRVNHSARLRDNARAVLRTYADQFQRLGYAYDHDFNDSTPPVQRVIFTETIAPTGLGLRWGALSDQIYLPGAPETLTVNLGSATSPTMATITRAVSYVNLGGNSALIKGDDPAGFMLQATFFISYIVNGRTITGELSILRLI